MCGCGRFLFGGVRLRGEGPYGRPFTDEDYTALSTEARAVFDDYVRLFKEEVRAVEFGEAAPSEALKNALRQLIELGLGDTCTINGAMRRLGLRYEDGEMNVVPSEPVAQAYRDPNVDSFVGRQY